MLMSSLRAEAEPFSGEISLILESALVQQSAERDGRMPRFGLELAADQGQWRTAWGYGEMFNKAWHTGRVIESAVGDDRVRLKLEMKIEGDPWVPGGRANYTVDLRRAKDGKLSGTYVGTFAGRFRHTELKGEASGELLPQRQRQAGNFVPVKPGEHPRILFRKSELAALNAKAASPFGKALVERLEKAKDHGVALGMLYQLTGDEAYAKAAMPVVNHMMKTGYRSGANSLPEPYGYNIARIAMTYDLCHDAWPEDYRKQITEHLTYMAERLLLRPNTISSKMNWDPGSNYQPGTRGGAALATLALWADTGPAPAKPRDTVGRRLELAAPAGLKIGPGVSVVKAPANLSEHWLVLGPMPAEGKDEDVLAALGGRARALPDANTKIKRGNETFTFHKLPAAVLDRNKYTGDSPAINAKNLVGGVANTTCYLFGVVEVDAAKTFKCNLGTNAARMWLAGNEVQEHDFITLAPGRYPLMIQLTFAGVPEKWIQVTLGEIERGDAEDELARRRQEHALALQDWERDTQSWAASGGMDPHRRWLTEIGRRHMAKYYQYMMGDGGWQAEGEGYTLWSVPLALEYAHAHRRVFGQSASARPDVTHFAPRYLMQAVFPAQGRVLSQSWGEGEGTLGARHYARVFSATDSAYQPAVLWAWNRVAGIKDQAAEEGDPEIPAADAEDPMDAVFTLINYPLELHPQHPEQVMDKTWAAPGRGGYIFRNGWKGEDDIVAQVFLKTMPPTGWSQPNAGSLRIRGLGHVWALKGNMPKSGERIFENVVLLPEDPVYGNGGAFPTSLVTRKDGSGAITMDMGLLYRSKKTVKVIKDGQEREAELDTYQDNAWRPENLTDLGIKGLRAFAADYSDASGAPGLFVLVDTIEGGKSKVWTWQLPTTGKGKDFKVAEVDIAGNAFTLKQGDATLKATFIAPADVKIERIAGEKELRVVTSSTRMEWGVKKFTLGAIQVTGADPNAGDFMVVMTLQRGEAPAVSATGTGLDAKVTVGRQTVRFDGQRIVFGE